MANDRTQDRAESDESTGTVLLAGSANLAIAVAKLVGGLISGSTAMLAEAAHSFADTLNQVFLMAALKRSKKPADAAAPVRLRHGALLLVADRGGRDLRARRRLLDLRGHQGGARARGARQPDGRLRRARAVSFLFEGASWLKAVRQLSRRGRGGGARLLRAPADHARPDGQDGRLRGHRRAGRHRAGRGRHHPAPPDRRTASGTGWPRSRSACCSSWWPTRSASRTSAR